MKIGNLKIEKNIFLAPMAGITDLAFRLMCRKFGCAFTYTEMISSKALFYNDKKTHQMMITNEADMPFAVQIFGNDSDIMSGTLDKALASGASMVDINMGCPAPKIVDNHEGSYLLLEPKTVEKIVSAVRKKTTIPVTVKIRKGFDANNVTAVEIAKIAEASGADAVCVHGRTREQYYGGKADWDIIKSVKENLNIPVIGNGDVFTPMDAKRMMEYTGCDAIMIGRAAQGNPFIFQKMDEFFEFGEVRTAFSNAQIIDNAIEHIQLLVKFKGEHIGILESRKHAAWYIKGMHGATIIKEEINHAKSFDQMQGILRKLL